MTGALRWLFPAILDPPIERCGCDRCVQASCFWGAPCPKGRALATKAAEAGCTALADGVLFPRYGRSPMPGKSMKRSGRVKNDAKRSKGMGRKRGKKMMPKRSKRRYA